MNEKNKKPLTQELAPEVKDYISELIKTDEAKSNPNMVIAIAVLLKVISA